jgi:hypothetical protein
MSEIDNDGPLSFDDLAERARKLEAEGRMPSPEQLAEAIEEAVRAVLGRSALDDEPEALIG